MAGRSRFIGIGAVCGFIAVASGAFGAHALSGVLSERMLDVFDLAADYLMMHGLALILIGILVAQNPTEPLFRYAGATLLVGVCIFSGSLFALSLSGLGWLGMVTPVGGLLLLTGWLMFAWGGIRQ